MCTIIGMLQGTERFQVEFKSSYWWNFQINDSIFKSFIAPEPIQCPATHPYALEKGKCCCYENVVQDQILQPSIETPCIECDDSDPSNEFNERKDCFDDLQSEYCINYGNFNFLVYPNRYVQYKSLERYF